MKVLIEGEKYPLVLLESIVDVRFYKSFGEYGIISYVGYFYSISKSSEIIYILPKIFIDENKIVLFEFKKDKLAESGFYLDNHLQSDKLKRLLILFYRSLQEYRKREIHNTIVDKDESLVIDSNIGEREYSYLDIILNLINFHHKNKNIILFIEKEHRSKQHKKISWDKTIRKNLPFIDKNQKPIYEEAINKRKIIDSEEILLSMFYSVLYQIKEEYKFNISIDKIYKLYKGKAFETLSKKAPKILKKIKYKYFSDTLLSIYKLLEIYFNHLSTIKSKNKSNEFIRVDNYHIIFEDMIDKLFSDPLAKNLQKLKYQKDGKEIDHIFQYDALLNSKEQIFYIGDSKYYKTGANIGENSKYKQFTYVKNVIQFNVGIINGKKEYIDDKKIRYRDEITEGYNISPNFFIQGKIYQDLCFKKDMLDIQSNKQIPEITYHFEDRLFDRDTLFVHYYDINFLFVLQSYTQMNTITLKEFREKCKVKFRNTLIGYLQENYTFLERKFNNLDDLKTYVDNNFRELSGKIYHSEEDNLKLIYATTLKDKRLDRFKKFNLL